MFSPYSGFDILEESFSALALLAHADYISGNKKAQ
jgi:hypothetical protein